MMEEMGRGGGVAIGVMKGGWGECCSNRCDGRDWGGGGGSNRCDGRDGGWGCSNRGDGRDGVGWGGGEGSDVGVM